MADASSLLPAPCLALRPLALPQSSCEQKAVMKRVVYSVGPTTEGTDSKDASSRSTGLRILPSPLLSSLGECLGVNCLPPPQSPFYLLAEFSNLTLGPSCIPVFQRDPVSHDPLSEDCEFVSAWRYRKVGVSR